MATNVISLDNVLSQKNQPYDKNVAILVGMTSTGNLLPIKIDDVTGQLTIGATIDAGDLEIGAVEIKDGTTDTRTKVKSDGTDNALVVLQNKGHTIATTAPSVTDISASVLAANDSGRKSFTIKNDGSKVVYIGGSSVTSANGFSLASGDTFSDDSYSGAVYAVCGSGDSSTLRIIHVTRV